MERRGSTASVPAVGPSALSESEATRTVPELRSTVGVKTNRAPRNRISFRRSAEKVSVITATKG
jgi:hypothetical protein